MKIKSPEKVKVNDTAIDYADNKWKVKMILPVS